MFFRVAIHCTCCDSVIASTNVSGPRLPRRVLHKVVREKGAVTDQAGRWYCGPGCRTVFRLRHDTSHKETPTLKD